MCVYVTHRFTWSVCTFIAVVDLATEGKLKEAAAFFENEYQLDHLIGTLDTPYVAIMDGITSM